MVGVPDLYSARCCDEWGVWTEGQFKTWEECEKFTRGKPIVFVRNLFPITYADIDEALTEIGGKAKIRLEDE